MFCSTSQGFKYWRRKEGKEVWRGEGGGEKKFLFLHERGRSCFTSEARGGRGWGGPEKMLTIWTEELAYAQAVRNSLPDSYNSLKNIYRKV